MKDCVGRSENGFIYPLYCRDILPCLVIRQEQFFFGWQNLFLSHLSTNTSMEISKLGDKVCLSIPAASQNTCLERYHKVP